MENHDTKVSEKVYIPASEFYSQVIDSMQDYAVITIDRI